MATGRAAAQQSKVERGEERPVLISAYVPPTQRKRVRVYCAEKNLTMSKFISGAIDVALADAKL